MPRASAIHVAQAMDDMMKGFGGKVESGEWRVGHARTKRGAVVVAGGVCEVGK